MLLDVKIGMHARAKYCPESEMTITTTPDTLLLAAVARLPRAAAAISRRLLATTDGTFSQILLQLQTHKRIHTKCM